MQKLIITVLSLLFVGCNVTNDSSNSSINLDSTQRSYVLGNSVTIVLQNNSNQSIIYGAAFTVEQKIQGKWKNIGPSVTFVTKGYALQSGSETQQQFALTDSSDLFPNHSFSEGQYRVTKDVEIQGENHTLKSHTFDVYAVELYN
jgi:hypothetical protein